MIAPADHQEKRRLNVLWQYEVLDSVPEEIFDDLTELAARICEAPIALITLVDEKRQWFKSKVGVTVSETSRDISFCAHAIRQTDLFIVPDATKDERFAHNPFVVSDPKVRFYAGAPLVTPDGYALGTLCVIDKVPRDLREDQKQALRILARHVVSLLELRRRNRELKVASQETRDLRKDLQKAQEELTRVNRLLFRTRHSTKSPKPAKPARAAKAAKARSVRPGKTRRSRKA